MFLFADNMPNVLWIWDVQKLSHVAVLQQDNAIKGLEENNFLLLHVCRLHNYDIFIFIVYVGIIRNDMIVPLTVTSP